LDAQHSADLKSGSSGDKLRELRKLRELGELREGEQNMKWIFIALLFIKS